jgi:hypothetical protein
LAGISATGVRAEVRYFQDLVGTNNGNTAGIDFGSFHFWRASIGATLTLEREANPQVSCTDGIVGLSDDVVAFAGGFLQPISIRKGHPSAVDMENSGLFECRD